MFSRHVTARLARYCDGDLPSAEMQAIEAHLAKCDRCRGELDELRLAARLVRQLAMVSAPASVWSGIDSMLEKPVPPARALAQWAFACVALLLTGALAVSWWMRSTTPPFWEVTSGAEGRSIRMAAGEWIDTSSGAPARIIVGDIGTVDVEPGTRVRLGDLGPAEYRLALARGTISARITAPPRLFIVDTPISRVVDLGCAYTVSVDDDGASLLRMTEGWAALEWEGRESLVPAGAICRTRRAIGPGMPYFEDAPAALKRAVDAFDAGERAGPNVDVILAEARVRDTLTLWHLLSRVDPSARARVYDRIAVLVEPPRGVTREEAIQLDPEALRLLREELAWHW